MDEPQMPQLSESGVDALKSINNMQQIAPRFMNGITPNSITDNTSLGDAIASELGANNLVDAAQIIRGLGNNLSDYYEAIVNLGETLGYNDPSSISNAIKRCTEIVNRNTHINTFLEQLGCSFGGIAEEISNTIGTGYSINIYHTHEYQTLYRNHNEIQTYLNRIKYFLDELTREGRDKSVT